MYHLGLVVDEAISIYFRVIDGENITVSDEHMWLIPYTEGSQHILTISFNSPVEIVGLRFWNYNKSPEDTYRGVRFITSLAAPAVILSVSIFDTHIIMCAFLG